MRLPTGGAVTGWASLRLAGAAYFDGLLPDGRTHIPVPLAVGPARKLRSHPGSTVSRERLPGEEVTVRQGMPCTVPLRALYDEMRRPDDWREAVVALDMAAAAELVSINQVTRYLGDHSGWRRSEQVRRALHFASERSRSPAETRMRLMWEVDARLPRPLVNQQVFDAHGRLVCVADLFDPVAGLVAEYDGSAHRTRIRHARDVAREEACRRIGLEYLKVTGPDMSRPKVVVERMHSSRSRAKFLPPDQRAWTLDPPSTWATEESLDEMFARRAWLEAQMREESPDGGPPT